MTARIGAQPPDWIVPGVNPVPRTGASEAPGPPGLEHPGGRNGKRTNVRNPDRNIRGGNGPRLEHPGGRSPGLEHPGK